jgi:hypothetical protein
MQLQTPDVYRPKPSPTVPTALAGHVTVDETNAGQTISVPRGTTVEVVLSNGQWTIPEASSGLKRLSAAQTCNGDVKATFEATRSGTIASDLSSREASFHFKVSIRVNA